MVLEPINYQGISILLGAVTVLITAVGGMAMQVAIFLRQGRIEREAVLARAQMGGQIAEVHTLVNGLSDKRDAATQKSAHAEGVIEGGDKERANPTGPLPR